MPIDPPHAWPDDAAIAQSAIMNKIAELESDTTTDKELLSLIKVLTCVAFGQALYG